MLTLKLMYWLHLQLQRKWWRMVRKSNVEKLGQELQNRKNILPYIRFTSNNTAQN
ncbi:unnamed protein product [Brassica oleracea]